MPITVSAAFDQFRSTIVDLDPNEVVKARSSKAFLEGQVTSFPEKLQDFPLIYGQYIQFGSFARRTKVRPLDDIDMLVLYREDDVEPELIVSPYTFRLRITKQSSRLWPLRNEYDSLSSIKVLNRLKSALEDVSYYQSSRLNRYQEAVTLNLLSYPWVFDLVTAFPVRNSLGNVQHYLIPDGSGYWKRTDPRVDQTNVTTANVYHNSKLIPLIRIMKYWNARNTRKPKLSSYYFETMIINGMKNKLPISGLKESVPTVFNELQMQLTLPCPDPKRLGPNLDDKEDPQSKQRVKDMAREMAQISREALDYEAKRDHKRAIEKWQRIFPSFPDYG